MSPGTFSGTPLARGPMGGDSYTQVHRGVFRDPRLSAKAKGIFGLLSTHTDGWQVSIETLAADMRDGRDAIRTALRELETHHYLIRAQERREGGAFGGGAWFYTDLPAQIRALGITDDALIAEKVTEAFTEWQNTRSRPTTNNPSSVLTSENLNLPTGSVDKRPVRSRWPRSGPTTGFPPTDNPPAVQPPAANPPYKKRIDQKTISRQSDASAEHTAAVCLPDEPPAGQTPPDTPGSRVLRTLRLARPVTTQIVRQHHAAVTALLETSPEAELIAHLERETTGDQVTNPLGLLVAVIRSTGPYLRNDRPGTDAHRPPLPPPCGRCDARPTDHPAARMITTQSRPPRPCPRCHPSTFKAAHRG
ncbi:helix-turn-helix domain-containing protein [Actinokineospora sp. 24-640]